VDELLNFSGRKFSRGNKLLHFRGRESYIEETSSSWGRKSFKETNSPRSGEGNPQEGMKTSISVEGVL
jgi:hypothetical protein